MDSSDDHSSSATKKPISETLTELQHAIWTRRPILADIVTKQGDKTLDRYAQDFFDVNTLAPFVEQRRQECIDMVQEITETHAGHEAAAAVAAQLRTLPLVSTSDHHAIIDNPYWMNANIITALPCIGQVQKMPLIVVFSFAGVSLNNPSGFPRGIEFHGGMNGEGALIRLPFYSDKEKMCTVYGMRPFTAADLDNALSTLAKRTRDGDVLPEKAALIRTFIETYIKQPAILNLPDLDTQITAINQHIWPHMFHDTNGQDASAEIPGLLYLDIETLVSELLLRHHLKNPSSLMHRALFQPAMLDSIARFFDGVPGAFCAAENTGTFFFWAINEKGQRVRLMRAGQELVSDDGAVRFALEPEALENAIRSKKIFPSTALNYLVIALYYGMKCLGGFCQVHDLSVLKEAWISILRENGETAEADALIPLQTKEMNAGGMMLTYMQTSDKKLIIPSGIDMAVERTVDTRPIHFKELAQRVTLYESMQPMFPGAYKVFYPMQEREIDAENLTFDAVAEYTGLLNKFVLN